MTTPTHTDAELTPRQREYLQALQGRRRTGKQMRGWLRRRGVRGSNVVFYRSIQRLKKRTSKLLENPSLNDPVYKVLQRLFKAGSSIHLNREKETTVGTKKSGL